MRLPEIFSEAWERLKAKNEERKRLLARKFERQHEQKTSEETWYNGQFVKADHDDT